MKSDIIVSREDFDIRRILDCGQVFRYFPEEDGYTVIAGDKACRVTQDESRAVISSGDPDYFADYFDLGADYSAIRGELQDKPFMREAVEYGRGIRILRQQPFETLMSFIVSANNHIPRIKGILNRICERLGEEIGEGRYAFPSPEAMAAKGEAFYASLGAGYRAEYLADTARRIADGFDLDGVFGMPSDEANRYLCRLKGVGPKVADCILLFAFRKYDVFPVDTWIRKVYSDIVGGDATNAQMRKKLCEMYGKYAGIAQQYLFFYKRETSGR